MNDRTHGSGKNIEDLGETPLSKISFHTVAEAGGFYIYFTVSLPWMDSSVLGATRCLPLR